MKKIKVVEPIRSKKDLKRIIEWFNENHPKYSVLFLLGITSGLRISDILNLNVDDVLNKQSITIREKKTDKVKSFPIRKDVQTILNKFCDKRNLDEPLFVGWKGCRLDRSQVYRFINDACNELKIDANVGTHTMRKTFGYHHYRQFKDITLLQTIFNHASPDVTKRYIGITQDEVNASYQALNLFDEDIKRAAILSSKIKARRVESYIKSYLKNGGTRHKEFALDILDILRTQPT